VNQRVPALFTWLLHFKGYIALQAYRISHRLWEKRRTEFAARYTVGITQACMSSIIRPVTIGKCPI